MARNVEHMMRGWDMPPPHSLECQPEWLAALLGCEPGDFFVFKEEHGPIEHWCGLEISFEFLDYLEEGVNLADPLRAYVQGLAPEDAAARRACFQERIAGVMVRTEFWIWFREKIGVNPSRARCAEYITTSRTEPLTANGLGPKVPEDIRTRFRAAERAEQQHREWQSTRSVTMICEKVRSSRPYALRCHVEERTRAIDDLIPKLTEPSNE